MVAVTQIGSRVSEAVTQRLTSSTLEAVPSYRHPAPIGGKGRTFAFHGRGR